MAVNYNANADYIRALGTDVDNFTAFTAIWWVNVTSVDAERYLMRKVAGADAKWVEFSWADTDELECEIKRAGGAASARTNNLTLAANTDIFVACTYDEADGPRLFGGDLTTEPAEAGYVWRNVGAGATTDLGATNLYICNKDNNDASRLDGDLSHFQYVNKRMTLGELYNQWIRPHVVDETKVFILPGQVGDATTVPNLCDSNAVMTANGLSLADHAPLPPPFGFFQDWEPYSALFRIPRHPAIIYQTPAIV